MATWLYRIYFTFRYFKYLTGKITYLELYGKEMANERAGWVSKENHEKLLRTLKEQMQRKPHFTLSHLREYYDKYQRGEISFSRFKEMITEHYENGGYIRIEDIDEGRVRDILQWAGSHKTKTWNKKKLEQATQLILQALKDGSLQK